LSASPLPRSTFIGIRTSTKGDPIMSKILMHTMQNSINRAWSRPTCFTLSCVVIVKLALVHPKKEPASGSSPPRALLE